jgi:hypothetical protein
MAFEPENDLERSLIRAAVDAAHRPQFYRDFIASEIVAVTMGPQLQEHRHRMLNAGAAPTEWGQGHDPQSNLIVESRSAFYENVRVNFQSVSPILADKILMPFFPMDFC